MEGGRWVGGLEDRGGGDYFTLPGVLGLLGMSSLGHTFIFPSESALVPCFTFSHHINVFHYLCLRCVLFLSFPHSALVCGSETVDGEAPN